MLIFVNTWSFREYFDPPPEIICTPCLFQKFSEPPPLIWHPPPFIWHSRILSIFFHANLWTSSLISLKCFIYLTVHKDLECYSIILEKKVSDDQKLLTKIKHDLKAKCGDESYIWQSYNKKVWVTDLSSDLKSAAVVFHSVSYSAENHCSTS